MKKVTFAIIFVTSILILTLLLSPLARSQENFNPCSECHGGSFYQYFSVLVDDSANQIPLTLNVNETETVTVVIQNNCNAPQYSTLYSVSVTLSSAYGDFSVSNATYEIGELPIGTASASWQITGTSQGFDYLMISASAYNPHESIYFSDGYSPPPMITVGQPTETPPPVPTPTPVPTSAPNPVYTSTPAATPTPTSPDLTPQASATATPTPASAGPSPTPTSPTNISAPEFSAFAILALFLVMSILAVSVLTIRRQRIRKSRQTICLKAG